MCSSEKTNLQTEKSLEIYSVAKMLRGKHLTLDNAIDDSVGCAEATSYVLSKCKLMPFKNGIPGTATMYEWFKKRGDLFTEVEKSLAGDIIISPSGYGNGLIPGHVGVVGNFGIMSNDSKTGLWKENFNLESWKARYRDYGGIKTHFFRAV